MKKNSILWCDSTGKQRRFTAIDASDIAVDDVLHTATTLHKTGAAQWMIYFGDKGTPIKQWGISPDQAKVIAGMYKPVSQASNQHTTATEQNRRPIKEPAITGGKQKMQVV